MFIPLSLWGQATFPNNGKPFLDAHNCYPYEGQWGDRIDRALGAARPAGIEQDMAWYVDPATGKGHAVVSHTPKTTGSEPELKAYFFEHVRPVIEKALADNDRAQWPLIVLHFDFKDNQAPLLNAVWELLGEYEAWITTAVKTDDPHRLSAFDMKPLLVLTEDSDAQEEVFFSRVPVGAKLRLFGSGHTNAPRTLAAEELLTEPATNYRRWWNNSWAEVEEGGQTRAGAWTKADAARLRALVDHAHRMGYWIRFYTLDGFAAGSGKGWEAGYNFGSPAAARVRWRAAMEAGVNMIATDQYEDLGALLASKRNGDGVRNSTGRAGSPKH
jgi:hypothetical protein